mmetsp:Transcript_46768/g.71516  ORF Transcript_46768/g.71516 Transcript_46768/m.71516 type:complete len:96 (-) Transcript_46768:226-513(-)
MPPPLANTYVSHKMSSSANTTMGSSWVVISLPHIPTPATLDGEFSFSLPTMADTTSPPCAHIHPGVLGTSFALRNESVPQVNDETRELCARFVAW